MYYSEVSCNVENTLEKIEELKIRELFPIDWMGLVTISNEGKIKIDGEKKYKNLKSLSIIAYLQEIQMDMLGMEDGDIFKISEDDSFLISPIRVYDNYKVFYVCYSSFLEYNRKDIYILEFLTKVVYENVLLNHEKIQEQNYLHNVFNSIESSIISTDLEGIVTMANQATVRVLGWIPDQIKGKLIYDSMLDENRKVMIGTVEYVIRNNSTFYLNELMQGDKVLKVVTSPIYNIDEEMIGVIFITSDITKLKMKELELEQLKQFALMGELAMGIAHDIRNPLMGIQGCANILKKAFYEDPKYMDFIQPIIDEVDRVNEVVREMLLYATMTKKNNSTMINLNEVIDKCLSFIKINKDSKHINIEKKTINGLPLINGNNVQLQQAFINLLTNSIQAIETEGCIMIETSFLKEEGKILTKVIDNGVGISPDNIDKIFKSFYSTKPKGIGYGLSIAKRAIDKHDGYLKVNSEVNIGTTFEVYLPVRKELSYE